MINPLKKYHEWNRDVVGKKLLEVNGLIYVFETSDFDHPQQLQLVFAEAEKMEVMKCGKDGSVLELTDYPMQEKNLGEYGKELIFDISRRDPFVNFIGKTLLKVFLVFSTVEDAYIGMKLYFEDSLNLFILNIGDEINILESLPSSYEKSEGIKYLVL